MIGLRDCLIDNWYCINTIIKKVIEKMNVIDFFKKKRSKNKKRQTNIWEIVIEDSTVWITHPEKYFISGSWYKWAKTQAKVLKEIQNKLPDTHIYVRLYTRFPEKYKEIITSCQAEVIGIKNKKEKILLFPDCQNQNVLEKLVFGDSYPHASKSIYMIENQYPDWTEVITDLFKIVKKLNEGHSINEFSAQLTKCRCLSYISDSDLVIEKVDIPQNMLLDILKKISNEEGLDLTIKKM